METDYKDIMRYGTRTYEMELDKHIHQFIYGYENSTYVITMKNGRVMSVFEVKGGGVRK